MRLVIKNHLYYNVSCHGIQQKLFIFYPVLIEIMGAEMRIVTDRCIIRELTDGDAGELCEVLSDEWVMKYIEAPFDMNDTVKFIRSAGMSCPPMVYAIVWKQTEKVIGHVIFHPFGSDDYELGWILSMDMWGKGIAGEITKAMIDHAREKGISGLVIECDEAQNASRAIAAKFGFSYEGKFDDLDRFRLPL